MLINDILDLSKIESGTVVVDLGELRFDDLNSYVERTFRHVAEAKGVDFFIHLHPDLPRAILTDSKRLQQIIKNLLSNAFKFTHRGNVALTVERAHQGWSMDNEPLNRAYAVIAMSVSDSGIGISADKQQIIFEAFQQADGSTSRKYGGTGLGLAISREIARLLGGEIRLQSTPGKGSIFTLYLPQTFSPPKAPRKALAAAGHYTEPAPQVALPAVLEEEPLASDASILLNEVGDDRDLIQPGDQVLLIVDNDLNFARFLMEVAHEQGFKALATSMGAAALTMTREYNPVAVTLDICLPDIDGWRVLDRLKNDLQTRHIPVCVISTEEDAQRGLELGAVSVVAKPIKTKETLEEAIANIRRMSDIQRQRIVVVESAPARGRQIIELLESRDLDVRVVGDMPNLSRELADNDAIDCLIYDPESPRVSPDDLAALLNRHGLGASMPLIVYSQNEPSAAVRQSLKKIAAPYLVKEVQSSERLLDQVILRLHRPITKLTPAQVRMLGDLHSSVKVLAGKKVLLVDDDIRNIFALTSVLERQNMVILSAETGRDAIRQLQATPDIDIVLMDIMMPELDGIDTMRMIRKLPQFKSLPMVAVTAKAMKGDREKCIEAGAWDYLSKPVDSEQMLSVLRAWLHR